MGLTAKELIDDPEYIPISKGTYRYKGNYIDDKFEGKGILYGINNIIIKAGFFQDGNIHGFGQLGSGKNLKYEGFFTNDSYDGKFIFYHRGKKKFEDLNYSNGIGIEYFSNGKIWRKAFYSLGKICYECYGILYDKNGKEIYHGLLNNGKPKEGKSLIIYDNYRGELYRGDFSLFKYNGNGILYNSNGNIKFKGIFKDDQYLKGILYYDNGKVNFEGLFIDQHFKKGILYDEEGFKIYDGEFIVSMINIIEPVYYIIKRKIKCILMAFLKIIPLIKENYMIH